MNIKWIILGVLAVMLLVAFGRNPVEEARKNREALKKGKDPLIEAIMEHNTKGPRRTGGTNFTPRARQGTGPEGEVQPPAHMMRKNYQPPVTNQPQQQAPQQQPPQQAPQQPPNSYYPPPPLSDAGDPLAPAMATLKKNPDKGKFLTTGQPVGFSGTSVYTYDEEGKSIPMPDGVYSMYDGQVHIIVQQGRQILHSN